MDHLDIPSNNLLDGRVYDSSTYQGPAFVVAAELREGDVISDGVGVYQVSGVGDWDAQTPDYIRHIRIVHTIAGPVMGGLLRGRSELVRVLARRR